MLFSRSPHPNTSLPQLCFWLFNSRTAPTNPETVHPFDHFLIGLRRQKKKKKNEMLPFHHRRRRRARRPRVAQDVVGPVPERGVHQLGLQALWVRHRVAEGLGWLDRVVSRFPDAGPRQWSESFHLLWAEIGYPGVQPRPHDRRRRLRERLSGPGQSGGFRVGGGCRHQTAESQWLPGTPFNCLTFIPYIYICVVRIRKKTYEMKWSSYCLV